MSTTTTTHELHEHEIGGLFVIMTREQAARWNAGETTEQDQVAIMVTLPDRYAQATTIRDGEIVMGETKLTEHSRRITLRDALRVIDLVGMLDGCEAVEVRPAE